VHINKLKRRGSQIPGKREGIGSKLSAKGATTVETALEMTNLKQSGLCRFSILVV